MTQMTADGRYRMGEISERRLTDLVREYVGSSISGQRFSEMLRWARLLKIDIDALIEKIYNEENAS